MSIPTLAEVEEEIKLNICEFDPLLMLIILR